MLEEFLERNAGSLALFEELESLQYITVIRPHLYLCDASRCRVATEDAKALYRDEDHLSIFGATYVSPNFDDLIKSLP